MTPDSELKNIKGVGVKTAALLESADLKTVEDLLTFFPKSYEDYTHITPISELKPGNVSLHVQIENLSTKRVRRGMHITEAVLADRTGKVAAVWFNQPYRADQLRETKGDWLVSGKFDFQGRKYQLVNPSVEKAAGRHLNTARIVPNYPSVKGIKSHVIRKLLAELQPFMKTLPDTLPEEIIETEQLLPYATALHAIHFPQTPEDIEKAKQRIAFEELFSLFLASQLNKEANTQLEGWHIPFDENHAQEFVAHLPFKLTDAQRIAIWQIAQDFEHPHPMNRLLQGDVGSGKTVVAGMAASLAAQQGFQTAIMAPTEILANQHADTISRLLTPFGVNVALLTGSVKPAAKKIIYDAVEKGEVDIVVGTHALIQDKVKFFKLGFVAIDEQHRFGVMQRQQLLKKSERLPHLLSMTATPIPRSLALTVYGELDISVLNELPKGRKAIKTSIVSPNSRVAMYAKVEHELQAGRQAYVVCPLIDNKPGNEKRSVEAEYKKLQKTVFTSYRIGLLHGQLSSEEKQSAMAAFASHEIDILVCTTVVEVGVDVPNATVMIIENADQFGLSQAHQLRGRVGRGIHQSYCFLVNSTSLKPTRRLQELEKSQDGFYLSEVDLKLRGPGQIYGRAQHGQLNLKIANLSNTKLLAKVQQAVKAFLPHKNSLVKYKQLASAVEKYQRLTTLN